MSLDPHCFHWLHLLRIFFTVAGQRSFSKAAATLFVSQPAKSKAVRELEHQVDLPLLERGVAAAKGVRLTENSAGDRRRRQHVLLVKPSQYRFRAHERARRQSIAAFWFRKDSGRLRWIGAIASR